MSRTISRWVSLGFAVTLIGTSLVACGSPNYKTEVEDEISSFMLDFIIQQEIGGTSEYIQSSDQPWVDAPPSANLIVWAPPGKDEIGSPNYLNTDEPIKVWWHADNQLSEATDKAEAIRRYRQDYMENPASNIWAWGYYEFGIVSVASDAQEAEVYVGASCGPLCGHGYLYTLQRSASGPWEIIDSQMLWIA